MSNARETLALRNKLHMHLRSEELRGVYWPAVITAASPALDRGWTGDELARWCIADLSDDVANPGALIVTTLRELGHTEPPRDTTPAPINITEIRAQRAAAVNASRNVDHTAWANHIRTTIHTPNP